MVIHVRAITNEEGNRLRTIVRHPKDPIELRRAQVVLSSAQGFTPPYIARLVGMSVDYVRTLIHQFNSDGMDMLKPKWKPGGSYRFTCQRRCKNPQKRRPASLHHTGQLLRSLDS